MRTPLIRSPLEVKPPEDGHLAVQTSPEEWTALPPGSRFLIVVDPDRPDRVIPVFLTEVSAKRLVFRCNCGKPNCTRVLVYKLHATGHHPYDRR